MLLVTNYSNRTVAVIVAKRQKYIRNDMLTFTLALKAMFMHC